jgi:hypothetical protein
MLCNGVRPTSIAPPLHFLFLLPSRPRRRTVHHFTSFLTSFNKMLRAVLATL